MLSVFARLKHRLAPALGPAVRVCPDGFATLGTVVPWADVSRVLAYAGADGIRIEVRAAHLEDAVVLAETQPGFDAFVRMADRRLTFPLAWWEALPRTRRVVLFEAALHEVPASELHPAPRSARG
ncbi:hypothetical protein [Massilia putida]|uniref:hypothetical protein n=1 Tax=Massilia putida TaxID=1141883 RepID=UPI00095150D6|nr:hypothetical protein [Massilia putida]